MQDDAYWGALCFSWPLATYRVHLATWPLITWPWPLGHLPLIASIGFTTPSPISLWQEDAYQGPCAVTALVPHWLRGTLYRKGPGLWEVGARQLRYFGDGFTINGAIHLGAGEASAQQSFQVGLRVLSQCRRSSCLHGAYTFDLPKLSISALQ